jgi:hypothetical protein
MDFMEPKRPSIVAGQFSGFRGRPWDGSAKRDREPFDVILVKGFSAATALETLKRKVEAVEVGGTDADDHSGAGGSGSTGSEE